MLAGCAIMKLPMIRSMSMSETGMMDEAVPVARQVLRGPLDGGCQRWAPISPKTEGVASSEARSGYKPSLPAKLPGEQ